MARRKVLKSLVVIAFCSVPIALSAEERHNVPVPESWTLEGVVMYGRHGIRAPTKQITCRSDTDDDCMNVIGARPWPNFGV